MSKIGKIIYQLRFLLH